MCKVHYVIAVDLQLPSAVTITLQLCCYMSVALRGTRYNDIEEEPSKTARRSNTEADKNTTLGFYTNCAISIFPNMKIWCMLESGNYGIHSEQT